MPIQLDLNLFETYSLKSIGFLDVSNYLNTTVSNPSFEVTPPNYPKINLLFTPKAINIFKSEDILPSCDPEVPLPDGLYTVKYSVAPNQTTFVEKTFLRTALTTAKLQKAFLNLELACGCMTQQDKVKQIQQVQLLIEAAISSANNCDTLTALELLQKANKKLDIMKNCDC